MKRLLRDVVDRPGEIDRQVLDVGYAGGPDADHALRFDQFDRLDDGSRKQL
jgi:hypothetical protein